MATITKEPKNMLHRGQDHSYILEVVKDGVFELLTFKLRLEIVFLTRLKIRII